MCLNHMIPHLTEGAFPLCPKKCSVTTLAARMGTRYHLAGSHIPTADWKCVMFSRQRAYAVLFSVKLWCSTVDVSQSCFTIWPLPKTSRTTWKCVFHYPLSVMWIIKWISTAKPRPSSLLQLFSAHLIYRTSVYSKLLAHRPDPSVVWHNEKQLLGISGRLNLIWLHKGQIDD